VRIVENWISLLDVSKAGNIQAETEAIESLAGRDRVGDSTGTVTVTVKRAWPFRRLKEIKCYIF
jgi:hypothetical protein